MKKLIILGLFSATAAFGQPYGGSVTLNINYSNNATNSGYYTNVGTLGVGGGIFNAGALTNVGYITNLGGAWFVNVTNIGILTNSGNVLVGGGISAANITNRADTYGWFYGPSVATMLTPVNLGTNINGWTAGFTNGHVIGLVGYITNIVAGFYLAHFDVSCYTITNAVTYVYLMTNDAYSNIRGQAVATNLVAPGTVNISANGIFYLGANEVYCVKMSNSPASTVIIKDANLRVKRI